MIETALYLIPVQLSDGELNCVLPQANIALVSHIKHFIVENVRSARRFLKKCDREIDIDSLTFYELNRHTDPRQVSTYLDALQKGEPMGVISEAGCPAIADPGADVVAIAQRKGLKVRPLVGPSSILMGLMGSGVNGQSFAFIGYGHTARRSHDKLSRPRPNRRTGTNSHQRGEGMGKTPYRPEQGAHHLPSLQIIRHANTQSTTRNEQQERL